MNRLAYHIIYAISLLPLWVLYLFSNLFYLLFISILPYRKKVIENNNHEKYLENNPNDIYTIIIVIIDSDNNQKILFESMQAYLRYLSKNYVLR